jgi:hypothetical protein
MSLKDIPSWQKRDESDEIVLRLRNGGQCPDAYWRADVMWDGCIDLYRMYNGGDWNDENALIDYLHICDLDDLITRLGVLKRMALEYFGEDWG